MVQASSLRPISVETAPGSQSKAVGESDGRGVMERPHEADTDGDVESDTAGVAPDAVPLPVLDAEREGDVEVLQEALAAARDAAADDDTDGDGDSELTGDRVREPDIERDTLAMKFQEADGVDEVKTDDDKGAPVTVGVSDGDNVTENVSKQLNGIEAKL